MVSVVKLATLSGSTVQYKGQMIKCLLQNIEESNPSQVKSSSNTPVMQRTKRAQKQRRWYASQ